ncbi:hypothetical protein ACFQE5_03545, partial [Pseudonocardia hispaniensis]
MTSNPLPTRLRTHAKAAVHRLLATLGAGHSEKKIIADSRRYWNDTEQALWQGDSHWRDADIFDGNDLWAEL